MGEGDNRGRGDHYSKTVALRPAPEGKGKEGTIEQWGSLEGPWGARDGLERGEEMYPSKEAGGSLGSICWFHGVG